MYIKHILSLLIFFNTIFCTAQKIDYTDFEKEDSRNMNFEIIGKFSDNIIVYKNSKADNYFSVYTTDMKLKEKIKLKNIPYNLSNVDFISYPNFFYMIYQYPKKNLVYCEAIKFDNNGKKMEETYVLDTTKIPMYDNNSKIYDIIISDNKQKIGIAKAYKKNDRIHNLSVVLFDKDLKLQNKKSFNIIMDGRTNYLSEFMLDNDGDVFFAKCYSNNNNEYINKFDLVNVPFNQDTFYTFPIKSNDKVLDEIKMKIDNVNKRILMQSFYLTKKKGNVEGLFVNFFDKKNATSTEPTFIKFDDTLRLEAKGPNNLKFALNDFFIRQIYIRKDGGFIVNAESYYNTTSNNNTAWNRWDYYSATPNIYRSDYYNMGGRDWYWNNADRNSLQRISYFAENVLVLSVNKNGNLEWSNVVQKTQKDENIEDFLSYQTILTGGELHYLFNEKDRNDFLMYDNSINQTGLITRHPTLKYLNRQYQIMPRFGKQISAKEIIFPCLFKNYICFAKLDF